jgi:uncharacterized protein (DUF302 family)
MRHLVIALALMVPGSAAAAEMPGQLPGWRIERTTLPYEALAERLEQAVEPGPLVVVFEASPNAGAARLGTPVPKNMVVGVFAPSFAVRVIGASRAAMIEAPLRFFLTEEGAGSVLAWKLPTTVFAAYPEGGQPLRDVAAELDGVMAAIAGRALAP